MKMFDWLFEKPRPMPLGMDVCTIEGPVKFEYKIIVYRYDVPYLVDVDKELKRAGASGWELVAVIPETDENYEKYVFKRVKKAR